jgi:putative thioredoxin
MSDYVVEVSQSSFERDVLEASKKVPVVVDFWAPWCGPCRVLGPVLEKLANEYAGKFRLAKINSDENLELSARYGVRSIPNVKAFVGGELVNEFIGVLPESAVRKFIDTLIPSPAEELRLKARRVTDGNAAGRLLREALKLDPANDEVRLDLAEVLLEQGAVDEAADLLNAVKPHIDREERLERLRARLGFLQAGAAGPGESQLKRQIDANPANLAARMALANLYAARADYEPALAQLLEIVRRDKNYEDGAARKQMVSIFGLAQDQPELVSRYRRELSSTLY